MIKNKFKYSDKSIKKQRRRFKIKRIISLNKEQKFIIYVHNTNNHLSASLCDNGNISINVNTIKMKLANKDKRTYELIPELSRIFCEQLHIKLPNLKLSQLVFDIYHNSYSGKIKSFIDSIRLNFQHKIDLNK